MNYVSIDIETTGLDPDKDMILEIGAVAMPSVDMFRVLIVEKRYTVSPFIMNMHRELFEEIRTLDGSELPGHDGTRNIALACSRDEAEGLFTDWLDRHRGPSGKVVAAGKNFHGFDNRFLRRFGIQDGIFHHRALDPAMFYLRPDDITPPSLAQCLERAGLDPQVSHRALDDAMAVVSLLEAHGTA